MYLTENKHLIFDNPKKIDLKFFMKLMLSFLLSFFYKIKLNLIFPREKRNLKYNVSVCAIFKDEAKYLREWIEFHKIVGIEHFYLYNNFSTDDYLSVLTPYIDSGLVTLIDWPVMQGQMSAYRNCVERFQNETQWIGFIDIDEFVCPNSFDKIGDFLEQFKKRPIVIIYWRYFGSSGILERDELQAYLKENEIGTIIHYLIPPHKQEAYKEWNCLSFSVTEKIHAQELSIPMSPTLTDEQVKWVIKCLNDYK